METKLKVEIVNTLVTIIATALAIFLSSGLHMWLVRRYWKRMARGGPTDMLLLQGVEGLSEFVWKARHSAVGDRARVICDLLPYVLVIATLQLLPYSTSGVSATASEKEGSPVKVIGTLASPAGEPIETLDLATLWSLQKGETAGGAAPFLLGSPELGNYGTDVTGLDRRFYFSGTPTSSETAWGATDLTIFGSDYTVEQDGAGLGTYPVSTCLIVVPEDSGDYSVGTCDDVITEVEAHGVVFKGVSRLRGCKKNAMSRRTPYSTNMSLITSGC